jgi:predicted small secreted protein
MKPKLITILIAVIVAIVVTGCQTWHRLTT